MSKRLAVTVGVITGLVGGGYLIAPYAAKRYVEKTYPGVTIIGNTSVDWGRKTVTFYDVDVQRGGIDARLEHVRVDLDRNVMVTGGKVRVVLSEKTGEGSATGVSLRASRLDVTLTKGDATGVFQEARLDAEQFCFDSGKVDHPKVTAAFGRGCVRRDKTKATFESLTIPVEVPFRIPEVDPAQKAILSGVTVDVPKGELKADHGLFGPFSAPEGFLVNLGEDISISAPKVSILHPWISPEKATFEAISLRVPRGVLKREPGIVDVSIGRAHVKVDPVNRAITGEQTCAEWVDALPRPLPKPIEEAKSLFSGSLSFEVRTKPSASFTIRNGCRATCGSRFTKDLRGAFQYTVYDRNGDPFTRTSGPKSRDWVALSNLPPHVPEAFVLLEDPGFSGHKGILPKALENSLKQNLETGRFSRGGSTITMQLAKNLWLNRDKTVTRKVEEALLTVVLESCFSKAEILSLYLNVIEYGPDLYGIGPASRKYFGVYPERLATDEAFYLASLLPNPKKALPPQAGGLDRARRIMKALAKSGRISEEMIPGESVNLEEWETALH